MIVVVVAMIGAVVVLRVWRGDERPTLDGFEETKLAADLNSPTGLAVAPGGQVFVAEQGGAVVVVEPDGIATEPFVTVETEATDEEGLTAIALDPDFEANGYVYVTYTALEPTRHERVSRFTADPDRATAVPASELAIVDLPENRLPYHLGGALAFGTDGSLLVTTGEGSGEDPQDPADVAGKVLRFNVDGTVPDDNPYAGTSTGLATAVWASGFRAPWAISVEPSSGRVFVSDVGESTFEEVDDVVAGGNYGWPDSEGPTSDDGVRSPAYSYGRDDGCAVVGGAFSERGYLFMDYCDGWMRALRPVDGSVTDVVTVAGTGPVAVAASGPDIYYLVRGSTNLDGGTGPGFDDGALYQLVPADVP